MKKLSDKLREEIVGKRCENFRFVEGGTLILYLRASPERSELPDETFWIDCAWRLRATVDVLVGSLDSPDRVLVQLKRLVGLMLSDARVADVTTDLSLSFSDGLILETFCHSTEIELWELRRSDGYRLGVGSSVEPYERTEGGT